MRVYLYTLTLSTDNNIYMLQIKTVWDDTCGIQFKKIGADTFSDQKTLYT